MEYESTRPPACADHPSRRARAACVRCGRYLCDECLKVGEEGALCPRCALEPRDGAGEGRPGAPPSAAGKSAPRPSPRAGGGACAHHPSERAVAFCAHCGAPLCQECRSGVGDQAYCPDCFGFISEQGASAALPLRASAAPRPRPPAREVGWKLWPGLAFLPFPFLLEFLVTYMINEGGEMSLGAAVLFISTVLYATLLAFAAWQVGGPAGGGAGWLRGLGVTGRHLKDSLYWGLLGGLASFGFTALLLSLSVRLLEDWGWIERWLKGLMEINVQAGVGRLDLVLAFVVVVLIGPLCEEAFFRGYLYPPMRSRLGAAAAMAANAALFSLLHFSLFGLLSRMVAGLIFCALYEHTDNLAAPVTAHVVSNLIAFLLPVVSM